MLEDLEWAYDTLMNSLVDEWNCLTIDQISNRTFIIRDFFIKVAYRDVIEKIEESLEKDDLEKYGTDRKFRYFAPFYVSKNRLFKSVTFFPLGSYDEIWVAPIWKINNLDIEDVLKHMEWKVETLWDDFQHIISFLEEQPSLKNKFLHLLENSEESNVDLYLTLEELVGFDFHKRGSGYSTACLIIALKLYYSLLGEININFEFE